MTLIRAVYALHVKQQQSSSTPERENHFFMEVALCIGALPCRYHNKICGNIVIFDGYVSHI